MSEVIELSAIIVDLAKRVAQLESELWNLHSEIGKERQYVSSEQIDELTHQVEQNLTRKLKQRMEQERQESTHE
jgi:hypothetical protein